MKIDQDKPKLWYCILESIISKTTDDNFWISFNDIKKYIINNHNFSDRQIETNLPILLKELCDSEILLKNKNNFSFLSYTSNINLQTLKKNEKEIKKQNIKNKNEHLNNKLKEKYLGPDVIITKTGRVSVKKSYNF